MANPKASARATRHHGGDYIINGLDMLAEFGLSDITTNSSSFSLPYEDSTSSSEESGSESHDPFGPQPRVFMQSEHRKKEAAKKLERRRLRYTTKRMKKARKERLDRIERKKGPQKAYFERLPAEMILHIMRHTDQDDIPSLVLAGNISNQVWQVNKNACLRGIEVEQFPQFKWLFGEWKHRSPEQTQSLKDWVATSYSQVDGGTGDTLLSSLRKIDEGKFSSRALLHYLQEMEEQVDRDISCFKLNTAAMMTRRAALCLASFAMKRPHIVNEPQCRSKVRKSWMPMEDCIRMFERQPATTQAEIQDILQKVVVSIAKKLMNEQTSHWIREYFDPRLSHTKMGLGLVKAWIAKIAVAHVIKIVVRYWEEDVCLWEAFCTKAGEGEDLASLLRLEMETTGAAISSCSEGLEFAEHIGFDMESVLPGTAVERSLHELSSQEAKRLQDERLEGAMLQSNAVNNVFEKERVVNVSGGATFGLCNIGLTN